VCGPSSTSTSPRPSFPECPNPNPYPTKAPIAFGTLKPFLFFSSCTWAQLGWMYIKPPKWIDK